MKRVMLALAAIVGLGRSAQESTPENTSIKHNLVENNYRFRTVSINSPKKSQQNNVEQAEYNLQSLDSEIELASLSLYNLKECKDEQGNIIDQNLLHQEIRSLAVDVYYSVLEKNGEYAVQATAQARYLERCIEDGKGLLELYQAYFQSMEQEEYQNALLIAQEIGNAALEFETMQYLFTSSTYTDLSEGEGADQLEKLVLKMTDAELEESARYVTPTTASTWIEECMENKMAHYFLFSDLGEAERSCLASLIRVDNFSVWPYDVEDGLRGMKVYTIQDAEVRCQLETYIFLFGKEAPETPLNMYEFRDLCLKDISNF